MPLGIVSDEDFVAELNKEPVKAPEFKQKGRNGAPQVPDVLRNVIAEEGIKGTNNEELAKLFGISQSSASAYKHGATSTTTYHQPNESLEKHTKSIKDVLRKKAGKKAALAISAITEEEIEAATVVEKAMVAQKMSTIFKDMSTDSQSNSNQAPVQVAIFVPAMKQESDYDVIDVR